jgi:hypothetical protein
VESIGFGPAIQQRRKAIAALSVAPLVKMSSPLQPSAA